jgi:hypothetical protein
LVLIINCFAAQSIGYAKVIKNGIKAPKGLQKHLKILGRNSWALGYKIIDDYVYLKNSVIFCNFTVAFLLL